MYPVFWEFGVWKEMEDVTRPTPEVFTWFLEHDGTERTKTNVKKWRAIGNVQVGEYFSHDPITWFLLGRSSSPVVPVV